MRRRPKDSLLMALTAALLIVTAAVVFAMLGVLLGGAQ